MSLASLQKVALFITRAKIDDALTYLQQFGIFEVVRDAKTADEIATEIPTPIRFQNIEARIADLQFVIRFLTPVAPAATSFRNKLLGARVEASEAEALVALQQDFTQVVSDCTNAEEEKNRIIAERTKLHELETALHAWKELEIPLDFARSTRSAEVRLGSIEENDLADFLLEIENNPLVFVHVISHVNKSAYILAAYHSSIAAEMRQHFEIFRFAEAEFTNVHHTAAQTLRDVSHQKRDLEHREHNVLLQMQRLAKNLPEIKLAHDALKWEQEKKHAISLSSTTKTTYCLTGWVPSKQFATVKSGIAAITDQGELVRLESEPDEQAPVQFVNSRFIRPFQTITEFFGYPQKAEIDPTPFLAPFFVIFFGFCLTDAGYGLLLTLTFAVALRVIPASKEMKDILLLLLFCGISTIIWGVVFGGYFGMKPEQLPFLVNSDTGMFFGQVFDPVEDLVPKIMLIAYGFGLVQLLLGVALALATHLRAGNRFKAYFVSLPTILAVTFTVFWALGLATQSLEQTSGILDFFANASPLFGKAALAMLVVLIFSMGSGNFFLRPVLGTLILANEIIGWASNLLSYSRLFALGLATGIIAFSFNQVAATVGEMMPTPVAIPVMIIVILIGHSLNIALNFIGALVHTARLQFVEFFGRFFEGGGKRFSPLTRKSVYLFDPTR